jgi:hypothetical protein
MCAFPHRAQEICADFRTIYEMTESNFLKLNAVIKLPDTLAARGLPPDSSG